MCVNVFYYRSSYNGNPFDACALLWELSAKKVSGSAFYVVREFSFLMSPRKPTKLQMLLASWRGRAFTPEEIGRFDLDNVVGKGCRLTLAESPSPIDGRMRVEVVAVAPPPSGSKPMQTTIGRDFVPEWIAVKLRNQPTAAEHRPQMPNDDFTDDIPF